MPSTTGNLRPVSPQADPLPPGAGDRGPGFHDRGFAVLDAMIAMEALPNSVEDELAALRALEALREGVPLALIDATEKAKLVRHAQMMSDVQVEVVLDWIQGSGRDRFRIPGYRRGRNGRLTLLFVMLASIVAPYFKFKVLDVLQAKNVLGGYLELDALLTWMPRHLVLPGERRLCSAYLDLARDTLFDNVHSLTPVSDREVLEGFGSWPWPRCLLWLQLHRDRWLAEEGRRSGKGWNNPAVHARTLEFTLARASLFGPLARRGGSAAREALTALGYRDYRPAARPRPVARLALLLVLLLLTGVASWGVNHRLHAWDEANGRAAEEIFGGYGHVR